MPSRDRLTGRSGTFSIAAITEEHFVEGGSRQSPWHRVHEVGNLTPRGPVGGHGLGTCLDTPVRRPTCWKVPHLLLGSVSATAMVRVHFLAIFIYRPQFYPLELHAIPVIIVKTKKDLSIFQTHCRTPVGSSVATLVTPPQNVSDSTTQDVFSWGGVHTAFQASGASRPQVF